MNDSNKTLVVNVVNRHETESQAGDVALQSGEFTGRATIKEINVESVTATNTKTKESVSAAGRVETRGT